MLANFFVARSVEVLYSMSHSGSAMFRTRTTKSNAQWSNRAPAFVCPVRESGMFARKGFVFVKPTTFGMTEGGPLRR